MTAPWLGDATSLVEAYRRGEIHPREVLEESVAAIERSELNAVCHLDLEAARAAADTVDVQLPFGGVPTGVKELDAVAGWPDTEASLVFADRTSTHTSTQVSRLRAAGALIVAQTTASEFGGVNFTCTKLHGATGNPWNPERTPGGSSGGSAAAVAGGLLPLATGGDGGGSIRIPAGFCGLVGLKSTFGRIPKGPRSQPEPLTVTVGCLARSVRDVARWFDVCNGYDPRDTLSLPRVTGWEAGLGTRDLSGLRAAIAIDLGVAVVEERQVHVLTELAEWLIATAGLKRVDVSIRLPLGGFEWSIANLVGLADTLGDLYPDCSEDLTREMAGSMRMAERRFNLKVAGAAQSFRVEANEAMAEAFDEVDVIFAATNPDTAFASSGPMPTVVGARDLVAERGFGLALANNGALTIPSNLTGAPAISVPAGLVAGMPVGLQILARHHEEPLLLDLAHLIERERPWPLVAPMSPL
jgi:aspartyl-tRNA(Asn)/glutamyl-tRNA(Gln) amidotransferase subunit A